MKKFMFICALSGIALATVFVGSVNGKSFSNTEYANIKALFIQEEGNIGGGNIPIVQCFCRKGFLRSHICTVGGSGGYCGGDPCSNHDGNCR